MTLRCKEEWKESPIQNYSRHYMEMNPLFISTIPRILVEMPEGKRPLGRPRRRWVDNIKMGLREIGWDGIDWIDLAQNRDQWRALVNTIKRWEVLE
jgi:hypothetical protein